MNPDIEDLQKFGIGILNEVIECCQKNSIRYYIVFGTLLGAVRHKGFIPWDNDIDIAMPVQDYMRFLKIAKKELPQRYFIQTYKTDKEYNEIFAKVRVNHTTSMPLRWKNLNIHWGIGIDIFPIIGVYKHPGTGQLQEKLFGFQRAVLAKDFAAAVKDETWKKSRLLRTLYSMPRSLRHFVCDICSFFVMRQVKNQKEIAVLGSKFNKFTAALFLPECSLDFQNNVYRAPKNYDYVLTVMYGDYMTLPPESERNGHEGMLGTIIYDLEKDYTYYQNLTDKYEN